MLHNKNNKTMS